MDIRELPDTTEGLKQYIISLYNDYQTKINLQTTTIEKYQDNITSKEKFIHQQTEEIAYLRFQLNYYLNQRYGRKKDDVSDEQLILFDEPSEEEDKSTEAEPVSTEVKAHTRTRAKPSLPEDTPVKTIAIEPTDEEKQCACGHEKHRMGEEISERLEVFPLKYMLLKLVRGKYACRHCEDGVTIAPLPKSIIPKCQATPGALAHIIVSKYMDGLPLYRQATIFERMGLPWTRSLLCTWAMKCGEALTVLYDLMHADFIKSAYVQVDETPVQVLQQPKGQSQRHFMWAYLGWVDDKPMVLYDYQPTHGGQAAVQFLEGFRGILQTDGYAAYNSVLNVTHANDWAHARRKFVEVIKHTKKPGIARKVVDAIKQLYAIEHQAKAQKLSPEERTKLRQQQAPPILKDMKVLLEKKVGTVPPKHPLGRAIDYVLKRWNKLSVYIDHGEIEIDTNWIENLIRPFAVARKAWLFKGSTRGAEVGAILYSLLLTCKKNNIEPYAYMKYVLYKLPKVQSKDELRNLLPYHIDQKLLLAAYSQTWI